MPEVVESQKEAVLTTPPPRRFEIPVFAEAKVTPETTKPAEAPATPAPAESGTKVAQNTEEQAPSAKPEGEKPEEVTPEVAAKREGRRFERRLDKAYKARADAEARAQLLEKTLAEERAKNAPKSLDAEPKLEQFDYDPEKYAAAKADYAKAQAQKEYEAKQRTEAGKKTQEKLLADWEEKADRGAEKHADWQEKVGELQPTNPLISAIMEAENGDEIAYYLGTHPKDARRIAELSPLSQVREIGKLEAKLLSEPEKPKAPSKAPAPITPLTGVATIASPEPSDQDDTATWIKKRQKQVHGKR